MHTELYIKSGLYMRGVLFIPKNLIFKNNLLGNSLV